MIDYITKIKGLLTLTGISDLAVKFCSETETVQISYNKGVKPFKSEIKFTEIEALFNESAKNGGTFAKPALQGHQDAPGSSTEQKLSHPRPLSRGPHNQPE